jgi:hypothetical protein
MNKRERKIIIDRFVQVKNLTDWYKYKLSKDNVDSETHAYNEMRYKELDHEALTLGGLGMDLRIWDDMWNTYYDQQVRRNY